MGIGMWYEMYISDPVAFLFKNTDPRGSLRANVSNATVRCLSNMRLADMLETRHTMSQAVRAEVHSRIESRRGGEYPSVATLLESANQYSAPHLRHTPSSNTRASAPIRRHEGQCSNRASRKAGSPGGCEGARHTNAPSRARSMK